MKPFEKDELQDRELDALLPEWRAPEAPARLREAVFGKPKPWWRRVWTTTIPVPTPVAGALIAALAVGIWLWPRHVSAPRTLVKTVQVEVPVVQERVVVRTVYRDRPVPKPPQPIVWQPVAELRPRIISEEEPK